MQVTLTRRSMTSFDATRLSSQEERDMLQAIARLDLSYNSIALTKGMQYLGRLTELDVSHNCLETLDHLPLGLRRLNVGHNNLQALSGMVALTQLQWLDCSHNVLSTLAGLPPTNALRVVLASHNRLVSCKGLEGCAGLRELDVFSNLVPDVGQLGVLKSLHSLRVMNVGENPCVLRNPGRCHAELKALLPRLEELRGVMPAHGAADADHSGFTASASPERGSRSGSVGKQPHHAPIQVQSAARANARSSVVMAPQAKRAASMDGRGASVAHSERSVASSSRLDTPNASVIQQSRAPLDSTTLGDGRVNDHHRTNDRNASLNTSNSGLCTQCAALQRTNADLVRDLGEAQRKIRALETELALHRNATGQPKEERRSPPSAHAVPSRQPAPAGATGYANRAPSISTTPSVAAVAPVRRGPSSVSSAAPYTRTGVAPPLQRSMPFSASPQVDTSKRYQVPIRAPSPTSTSMYATIGRNFVDLSRSRPAAVSAIPSAHQRNDTRRPSSADARLHRLSNGGTAPTAAGPVPTLRPRSASVDARPRSADTSSVHKSVSFGVNEYFSPPKHYIR
jgi:hypothetical protein